MKQMHQGLANQSCCSTRSMLYQMLHWPERSVCHGTKFSLFFPCLVSISPKQMRGYKDGVEYNESGLLICAIEKDYVGFIDIFRVNQE